jgi:hypothetical protein
MQSLFYYIKNPSVAVRRILIRYGGFLSDEKYLSLYYRNRFHRKLELNNPKSFNEKLNWLKLYGHRPEYVTMADKYAVKDFVAKRIGEEYVVPCLGVWESADEIDFDKLPNQFALKCTHNSGLGRCICKDKLSLDLNEVRKNIAIGLKEDYYKPGRDKQYRDIQRKIIADQYLDDGTGNELRDYKWWCFDGKPTYMYYTNKGVDIYENFYDMDYNPVNINHGFPRLLPEAPRPANFNLMKELATKLSEGIPFVRVDFFDVNGHVYFGEFTFFDWGGLKPFENYEMDLKLGQLITLPEKTC